MPNVRGYMRSFNGGEVTSEFFGRIDDVKNQTGLRTCRNLIVKPHGPVSNRGGLKFIAKVKDSTRKVRLLRFVYSSDQSVAIEFGAGYFRFHTNGATFLTPSPAAWSATTSYAVGDQVTQGGVVYQALVANVNQAPPNATLWFAIPGASYEIPNPYSEDDLATVKYIQSNDVVTLTHPGYPAAELRRYGATKWVYQVISFKSSLVPPKSVSATARPATASPGVKTLQAYVVTAVKGRDESPSSRVDTVNGTPIIPTGGVQITSVTNANPGVFTIESGSGAYNLAVGNTVYISGIGGMPTINEKFCQIATLTVTSLGLLGVRRTITLQESAVNLDTTAAGTYTGGGTMAKVESSGVVGVEGVGSCSNNIYDVGAYNTVSWSKVEGAERYNVYRLDNGLYGFLGQTTDLTFKDEGKIAPDLSVTPPIYDDPIGTPNHYPVAVAYFEQRRCFAGSYVEPAYFWSTRSGTESALTYSIPSRDDDSVRFRIAARERCEIRHIVPMGNLILLTESAEWRVSPAAGEVLTPDVSVRPQSGIGAGHAPPILANNNLVFAAARGGHLRELAYDQNANGYITDDICLRAPHLFDGHTIIDMAYTKSPVPTVWAVSSSGLLLGMTYVPEQQVGAWHHHDTESGVFEHICVVPEGIDDVLYAIVRRTTALGQERFIERMAPRNSTDDEFGFYLDSALSYSGAPLSSFAGLDHLEGKMVSVVADGSVIPEQIVTGGAITLPQPASTVHAGLRVVCDLRTLPVAFEVAGYGQGRPKAVNAVWLRVFATRDIQVGPSFDKLTEAKPRLIEGGGLPPALQTCEVKVTLSPSWGADGDICVRHDEPTPFTLLSMAPEYAVAG